MSSERVDELLDVLGDERSRAILAALNDQPRSAKELATALDVSLPTVYRRLDDLEGCSLVTSRTAVASDGNHYQRYACALRRVSVVLDGTDYRVEIDRGEADDGDIADRFSDLWSDLSGNE